jgi:hypothetical protein
LRPVAYIVDGEPAKLQGRVERHEIDEQAAFEMLRAQSRRSGRKLVDVAEAVTTSHLLLHEQSPETERARKRIT